MPPFKWRHQYDPEVDEAIGRATAYHDDTPSLTQQQFTEEVNLNVMVHRMGIRDGAIPPAVLDPRYFGDFSNATDLRDALDRVREAEERFAALPADIRKRFHNDPVALHEFVMDPKNDDEAVKLGLLRKVAPVEAPLGSKDRPLFTAPVDPAKPADPPKPT